jgi:hypothetical protein
MFVPGQNKSLKARSLVGHFARQALCWCVRREPLVPYRRQSEDYRETGLREVESWTRSLRMSSLRQHDAVNPESLSASCRFRDGYKGI